MYINPIDAFYCLKPTSIEEMPYEEMAHEFERKIYKGEPFFAGRVGMTEMYNLRVVEFGYKRKYKNACDQLCKWSGFFPNNPELLSRFYEIYKNSLKMVDYLHPMYGNGEAYLISKFCSPKVQFITWPACWGAEKPWTASLKGKKVLVIHPFEDSIRKQYEKRDKLFPQNPDLLPEFELITIKAIQTLAGQRDERFGDWFEALDYMCERIKKLDFDVALIGCGAYGFPLGAYIRNLGKTAIHIGGDLQLQFGILGSRWDNNERVKQLQNQYWVRPNAEETPICAADVENACYW